MKHNLKIALFGLNSNVMGQLKSQILSSMPVGVQVEWVSLVEREIDVLMMNDLFFDAAIIQKMINTQKVKYLRLVFDEQRAGEIDHDRLYYPLNQQQHFVSWLQQHCFENRILPTVHFSDSKKSNSDQLLDIFCQLFTPRHGYIQLYDQVGVIALIDCRTERIWQAQPMCSIQSSAALNYSYASGQYVLEMTKDKTAEDLRTWLWKSLPQQALPMSRMHKKSCFQLDIWPQMTTDNDRRTLMKMAACFTKIARVKDVAESLQIPLLEVEQFVQKDALLEFGHYVDEALIQFTPPQISMTTVATQNIRQFFGKLRKKIGL